MTTLDQLKPGHRGIIRALTSGGVATQRLLEMGLMEGETVEVIAIAPFGDPMELRVQGFQLSIRKAEAAGIQIDDCVVPPPAAPTHDYSQPQSTNLDD